MVEDMLKDAEARMQKSIQALTQDLAKIRTGRAHPSLLDHVVVSYYGSEVPIKQVATIAIEDPRTLSVTPWEKGTVAAVEKAIRSSDLGLNPATSGLVIRVPLPPLTEERRRELVRIVRHEGENAKVAIRNIRRDANSDLKAMAKEKMISDDEERRAEEKVQALTDRYVEQVGRLLTDKEEELMSV
jgi:ribosome recycling factor